ncbi:hypothetical protein [Pedobacter sp. GR22-10]|uniref:hypothetical protein n=1 Tax=Pedobacter sp. GR22-10 TaxID=2994472 RepID=UPI0022457508|nr:hypothetical protein [Pedobacter sp. GR22-10]MCX2430903.1 hypothetical protein [Pedobacter sp. GR22-10]
MCVGLKEKYADASIYVSVTGVASQPLPGSGYEIDKETGQVYVAIWFGAFYQFQTVLKPSSQIDERNEIRDLAVEFIIEKILELIEN